MKILDFLKGYKAKIAAVGLLLVAAALAIDKKYEEAAVKALEGLGLLGIAFKIERSNS